MPPNININPKTRENYQKILKNLKNTKHNIYKDINLTLNMSDSYDLLAKVRKSENEYSYNHFFYAFNLHIYCGK